MNSLSWLNRGLSTDDCRKASDMQKCLSNGGSMVKNHAFHCNSEIAKNKKNDFDDYAFRCAAPYFINLEWV